MLWVKAFHIISLVTWFAGLFYLPRLFVYHADTQDEISHERFKIMERRLYYGITTPGGIATTLFGIWLLSFGFKAYMSMGWMHVKLSLIVLLWLYHFTCGHYLKAFAKGENKKSSTYFRVFNEAPTLLLIAIVILAMVKPF